MARLPLIEAGWFCPEPKADRELVQVQRNVKQGTKKGDRFSHFQTICPVSFLSQAIANEMITSLLKLTGRVLAQGCLDDWW
jgi:hypothetical protein